MPRSRGSSSAPLLHDLAAPIGLALLGFLLIWHGLQIWGFAQIGANDFRLLREATAAALSSGTSLYVPRTVHGNLNPPHFHLLLVPFTWLAAQPAFFLWTFANLVAGVASLWLITRELEIELSPAMRIWAVNALLAFAGTAAALWSGQSSLLLMWPATIAWRAMRRGNLVQAGTLIGLLASIKLFMLLFVPYWIIRRQQSAFIAAGIAAAMAFGAGLLVFGSAEYGAWVHTLGTVNWADEPWNASLLAQIQRAAGAEAPRFHLAWLGAATVVAALSVTRACWIRGAAALDGAFGCLVSGALLASPLGWIHYLWWAAGPLAAWLRKMETPFPPGWRTPMAILALAGLLCPPPGLSIWAEHWWGRAVFGSAYTCGLLAAWILLMASWRTSAQAATGSSV